MADDAPESPDALPSAYWWAVSVDSAVLYLRYGWVAKVSGNRVRIAADPPLYPATCGPCRGIAHGQRIVERVLAVRHCRGTPERRAVREQIRADRIRRKLPRPTPRPQEDDALLNP
jgi:hypothetical protein